MLWYGLPDHSSWHTSQRVYIWTSHFMLVCTQSLCRGFRPWEISQKRRVRCCRALSRKSPLGNTIFPQPTVWPFSEISSPYNVVLGTNRMKSFRNLVLLQETNLPLEISSRTLHTDAETCSRKHFWVSNNLKKTLGNVSQFLQRGTPETALPHHTDENKKHK